MDLCARKWLIERRGNKIDGSRGKKIDKKKALKIDIWMYKSKKKKISRKKREKNKYRVK